VKCDARNVRRGGRRGLFACVLLSALAHAWLCVPASAQSTLPAPADVRVIDTPNDGGESLTVIWAPSGSDGPDVRYQILFGDGGVTDPASLKVIAEFPSHTRFVKDAKAAWWTRNAEPTWHQYAIRSGKDAELKDGTAYTVAVALLKGEDRALSSFVQATPAPNWFNWNQLNNLIMALSFGGLVFYAIRHAKRNDIFLRRIPGLDAVDEAIGRARPSWASRFSI
jgi:hypothetical protein